MNIVFLSLANINSLSDKGIYHDLLREFIKNGHYVTVISPSERREKKKSEIIEFPIYKIIKIKTLNIQKTSIIEKGLGILLLEYQYLLGIKKHINNESVDLIIYPTPPITIVSSVKFLKNKYKAKSYLLLKDIFPQNAVDIGLIKSKSLIHRFFSRKEKNLYAVSDYIGCLSPKNIDFLRCNNPNLYDKPIEVNTNCIEILDSSITLQDKINIRQKFELPTNATIFIYGGNLGKPQGLDFLLEVLKTNNSKQDRFFLIVGSGTEFPKIERWFLLNKPNNAKLISSLPKRIYDDLVQSCDVGLIFLDPRFTIPNYPSRLLSYLEYKMPVLMATDVNTDVGIIAEDNGYGFWCENGDLNQFNLFLDKLTSDNYLRTQMGEKGYKFLEENYTVEKSYEIIMSHFDDNNV